MQLIISTLVIAAAAAAVQGAALARQVYCPVQMPHQVWNGWRCCAYLIEYDQCCDNENRDDRGLRPCNIIGVEAAATVATAEA